MNILSLFDGISAGMIALERADIVVTNYYASEIDKSAISVSTANYPKIIRVGDVTKVHFKDGILYTENGEFDVGKIDLLIGGSPCTGFSFAGKQENFDDPRSKLFYEYDRILKECSPKYFFLENVKMQKKFEQVITDCVGVSPIAINSALVSKLTRNRLYWTNIPDVSVPKDLGLIYGKMLYQIPHGWYANTVKVYDKYPCLLAQSPGSKHRLVVDKDLVQSRPDKEVRTNSAITRVITPEECEELQTLPIGYTNSVNKTQRYKMIGNGWTVDVIVGIFKNII
jgi:site-specific DNA-cytosine methylase